VARVFGSAGSLPADSTAAAPQPLLRRGHCQGMAAAAAGNEQGKAAAANGTEQGRAVAAAGRRCNRCTAPASAEEYHDRRSAAVMPLQRPNGAVQGVLHAGMRRLGSSCCQNSFNVSSHTRQQLRGSFPLDVSGLSVDSGCPSRAATLNNATDQTTQKTATHDSITACSVRHAILHLRWRGNDK
jgi:hypothetical protein